MGEDGSCFRGWGGVPRKGPSGEVRQLSGAEVGRTGEWRGRRALLRHGASSQPVRGSEAENDKVILEESSCGGEEDVNYLGCPVETYLEVVCFPNRLLPLSPAPG